MSSSDRVDVDALLTHAGWVRALAGSLVADPNLADDLTQQTWIAALQRPPRDGTPLKRWLAAVLRNFARAERRSRRHRAQREARSAHPEAVPSAHDAVARVLLQQELIEVVLSLEVPYRDAIIWRYFDGWTPREIAERQRVSINTVKTRLVRGIERLRSELDRRHQGDRSAWLSALIPLAGWPAVSASTVGAFLVNSKLKAAIVASLVLGSLAGVWTIVHSDAGETPAAPERAAVVLSRSPATEDLAPKASPPQRESAGEFATTARAKTPSTPAAAPPPRLARGRVIDVDSRGVAGVAVVTGPGEQTALATSGAGGFFEGPTSSIRGGLRARSAQYTTVLGVDAWENFDQTGLIIVVAPRIVVAGRVVDEQGKPVAGARVQIRAAPAFLQDLGLITDQSFEARFAVQADERGAFEFADAPGMRKAEIAAEAPGFERAVQAAPEFSKHEIAIVLVRNANPVVLGEVIDAHDAPVPGAWVEAGEHTTRTDAQGRFALEPGETVYVVNGVASQRALVAIKEGFLPGRLAQPPEGWPKHVTIRLGGAPLSIRGRVLDTEDHPIPGTKVWTVDEHRFARLPDEHTTSEDARTVEALLRGSTPTTTDATGAFELAGLLPGEYRLACVDKSSLRSVATEPLTAGTDGVTLRIPADSRCVRVAGRVVSQSKKPVSGVYVFPLRVLFPDVRGQFPPPPAEGDSRITDAEGRFEFEHLCADELYFQVSGQNLDIVYKWDPPPGAKIDDLEIVVSLRCHIQVDLGDRASLADGFRVLAEDGRALDLVRWEGSTAGINQTRKIEAGRSDIVSVSEEGRTVVLSKGAEEVQRIAVRLVPGEVTVVRP